MRIYLYLILFLITINTSQASPIELWKNGQSKFSIVFSEKGSPEKMRAVKYLQQYIHSKSGAMLPIVDENTYQGQNGIYIDDKSFSKDLVNTNKLSDRGYFIGHSNNDIILKGTTERGTLNAIFGFLGKYLDVTVLSSDYVYVNTSSSKIVDVQNQYYNPEFERFDVYNAVAYNDFYSFWNGYDHLFKNGFNSEWGMFGHTFFQLIPPEKYLKTNPDFFIYTNGKPSQLNIRNSKLIKEVIKNLKSRMEKNPTKVNWMVGQEDDKKFGSMNRRSENTTDELIRFVNAIAKEFPDKIIGTFAYQETVKAPLKQKPLKNVFICFAPIDAMYNINIYSGSNAPFAKELQKWKALTPRLMVWDYVSNYSNRMIPYPTFDVIAENMKFYKQVGVKSLYLEGINHSAEVFNDMYTYIFTMLNWDINSNVDTLMNDFCTRYYGPAGPLVVTYIKQLKNMVDQNKDRLRFYDTSVGYLSNSNLMKYDEILEMASRKVSDDSKYLNRINKLRAQIDFQILQGNVSGSDARTQRLVKSLNSMGVRDLKSAGKYVH